MEHEHEEVEQIPWRMLADQLEGRRPRRLGTIALAVAAALVAAIVAANLLRRPSGTTVELPTAESPPPTAQPAPAAATPSQPEPVDVTADGSATEAEEITAPGLYSEADLMAMVPLAEDRLVAAHAERFVIDYFTVLGPHRPQRGPAELPQPAADADGYSWVEWARAAVVVPEAPDRFEVTVLFRTLRRSDDGDFLRTPLRAVVIEMIVDADGAAVVEGIPRPGAVPAVTNDGVFDSSELSEEAASAALAAVQAWGSDARIEGAVTTASGWRVVVSVVDAAHVRWPLMVDVAPASDPES